MIRKLQVEIVCGKTTCASEPGKFCFYVSSRKEGTIPICALFPNRSKTFTELKFENGWLQRCPTCLKSEL